MGTKLSKSNRQIKKYSNEWTCNRNTSQKTKTHFLQPLLFNKFVYDFSNCNYNVIHSQLASTDWPHVINNKCIVSTVTNLYNVIFKIIDSNCTRNSCLEVHIQFDSVLHWGCKFFKTKHLIKCIQNLQKLTTMFSLISEPSVNISLSQIIVITRERIWKKKFTVTQHVSR